MLIHCTYTRFVCACVCVYVYMLCKHNSHFTLIQTVARVLVTGSHLWYQYSSTAGKNQFRSKNNRILTFNQLLYV
jgi:hypothetical protein